LRAWARFAPAAGAALLLAAGAAARLHGLGRSLWLDEAWVANSVLAPTLIGTLRYDAWLQTSPPLFLALERGAVAIAGDSNGALRAVPAAFSLAALALGAAQATRWLRAPGALAATAFLALSPSIVAQGAAAKPYASDVFAGAALLALGDAYLARPTRRRLALALAAGALLSPLSFFAPLFLPALALAALPRPGVRGRAPAWHALAAAATAASLAAALGVLCIAPNRGPDLIAYFEDGFWPGGGAAELAAWVGARLRLLAAPAPGVARDGAGEPLVAAVAALGLCDLAWRGARGDARAFARAALCAGPLLGALLAHLAGLLPFSRGSARLLLFLAVPTALAFGAGLEALARGAGEAVARTGRTSARRASGVAAWLSLTLLAVVLVAAARAGRLRALVERPAVEEAEGALALLASEARPEDAVYVHSTMRESAAFYARRMPIGSRRVVLGDDDWPCCPRGHSARRDEDPAAVMPRELARLREAGVDGRRLWVLVTARESHFRWRGHRSPAVLERWLAQIGCRREATTAFRGVEVDRYSCGSPAPP
jgi:hypothetical protein